MLAYAETCHTQNLGIFRTEHADAYSEPSHIYKNLQIFRTLIYLKPDTYLKPSLKMYFFLQKQLKTITIFTKCAFLDLRRVSEYTYLSINTHCLSEVTLLV